MDEIPQHRVSPTWKKIECLSEPFVLYKSYGYAPFIKIKVEDERWEKTLLISPKSLAQALQKIVESNNGQFTGLKIRVKKETSDQRAPYIVEEL